MPTSSASASTAGRASSLAPVTEPVSMTRAHGWGLATVVTDGASAGTVLDTWFAAPALGNTPVTRAGPEELGPLVRQDPRRRVCTEVRHVEIDLAAPPADAPDAYLRLHLLSHPLGPPPRAQRRAIFAGLTHG